MPDKYDGVLNEIDRAFAEGLEGASVDGRILSRSFYGYNSRQGLLNRPGRIRTLSQAMQGILAAASRPGSWLDLGCGNGVRALLLGMLLGDTGNVTGIDPWAEEVADGTTLSRLFPDAGRNVRFIQGDGCRCPVGDGSCDVVLLSSVYTHVREPEQLLAEVWRMLKSGGVLMFYDENNIRTFRRSHRRYRLIHRMLEHGPIHEGWLRVAAEPFRAMRGGMLGKLAAGRFRIEEKDLDATFALYGPHLKEYTDCRAAGEDYPFPDLPRVPHHPEEGWTPDYRLDPLDVMKRLRSRGFNVKHQYLDIPRNRPRWKQVILNARHIFPGLSVFAYTGFWLRAVKP